jgi:regulator of sigma E protease
MAMLLSVIGAIAAIVIIVLIHELGHFLVARAFGIRILKFSIGFGRPLWSYKGRSGTQYVLALIPLGGYVKMLGEETDTDQSSPDSYARQALWKRMFVVSAGPLTNFLLAFGIFWIIALNGVQHVKPVIGQVQAQSLAAKANLKQRDEILAVDNASVHDWQDVMMGLLAAIGRDEPVKLTVKDSSAHVTVKSLSLSAWRLDQREPDLFASLGFAPYMPPVEPRLAQVLPDSPAARAGLSAADIIIRVNQKPVSDWQAVATKISQSPNQLMSFELQRGLERISITVKLGQQERNGSRMGYLGVMVKAPALPSSMLNVERYSALEAVKPALQRTWLLVEYNAMVLAKMLSAKLSLKTMGGPISIFQAAGQSATAGWIVYFSFIAFISVTVGFINLLPIPGLDGGHLLFQVLELLFRRPVPPRIQQYGLSFGILFVLLLIIHATINDLIRLLS